MEQQPQPSSSSFTNAAFQPDSTFRAQVQGHIPHIPIPLHTAQAHSQPSHSLTAMMPANPNSNPANPAGGNSQSQSQIQPHSQTHSQPQPQAEGESTTGGATATAPFLRDFSLVAEAAKRAQMAVVMRDLEGISL